jgi:hypothetical protein
VPGAAQLFLDAYYFPAPVLPCQPHDERGELVCDRRTSR